MKSGEGDEIFGVLCILLAIACCFDYKTHRIPNWLIVCCMFAGLGYRLISGGHKGVLEYLASALLTTILLYFVVHPVRLLRIKRTPLSVGLITHRFFLETLSSKWMILSKRLYKVDKKNKIPQAYRKSEIGIVPSFLVRYCSCAFSTNLLSSSK